MTIGEAIFLLWIGHCAKAMDIPPARAQAVAIIETKKDNKLIRTGKLGNTKLYGPMGLNKDCFKKQDYNLLINPFYNSLIGVIALKGKDTNEVLKHYNPKADSNYLRQVKKLENQINKHGIFSIKIMRKK